MHLKNPLLAAFLIMAASYLQKPPEQPRPDIGEAQTSREISDKTALQNAFVQVLADTGFSGGVITVTHGCQMDAKRFHIPKGMRLPHALDELTASDGKHEWRMFNRAVVVFPTEGMPALLQTRIQEIQIQDKNNLTLAVNELLQAKPIRDEIAVLRLQLISPEIGFQQLTRGEPKPEPQPFLLRDTSLFDALNRIATEHGNAAWSYDEFDCKGNKRLRLDFIAR